MTGEAVFWRSPVSLITTLGGQSIMPVFFIRTRNVTLDFGGYVGGYAGGYVGGYVGGDSVISASNFFFPSTIELRCPKITEFPAPDGFMIIEVCGCRITER